MGEGGDYREDLGMAAIKELRKDLAKRPALSEQDIERLHRDYVARILANLADNEDGRINFRINSAIKKEFERLCGKQKSSVSRELRRYMISVVSRQSFPDK